MSQASGPNRDVEPAELVLEEVRQTFARQRQQAEAALAQLQAEDWHRRIDPESNSIAVIVRHVGGNLRSRWTDFLTTDGEKPDRDRDSEFEVGDDMPPSVITEVWDAGWTAVLGTIAALGATDLPRTVTIRGQPVSVANALVRSLDHTGHHVGQIVMLAKHLRGADWQTLSIPKRRP